ncbi:MAG TPA: formate dehydrogenase accessory protein FdhE [Vicinamibacterales bacterium]
MSDPWSGRIRRADTLAAQGGPNAALLTFYARLLRSQQTVYRDLKRYQLCGAIERDVAIVRDAASGLLRDVVHHGPDPLVVEARALLDSDLAAVDTMLMTYWFAPADRRFFAKAILQPYAELLTETGLILSDRSHARMDNRCPACGGAPQLAVLEASVSGVTAIDGGSRRLLCAICLGTWPFRRVLCPSCGEEDEYKLVYFQSEQLRHLRVDACESCKRYLKSVDLGQLGLAVPLVDEIAGAPLDLWARDQGYEKIELNLVGL